MPVTPTIRIPKAFRETGRPFAFPACRQGQGPPDQVSGGPLPRFAHAASCEVPASRHNASLQACFPLFRWRRGNTHMPRRKQLTAEGDLRSNERWLTSHIGRRIGAKPVEFQLNPASPRHAADQLPRRITPENRKVFIAGLCLRPSVALPKMAHPVGGREFGRSMGWEEYP